MYYMCTVSYMSELLLLLFIYFHHMSVMSQYTFFNSTLKSTTHRVGLVLKTLAWESRALKKRAPKPD